MINKLFGKIAMSSMLRRPTMVINPTATKQRSTEKQSRRWKKVAKSKSKDAAKNRNSLRWKPQTRLGKRQRCMALTTRIWIVLLTKKKMNVFNSDKKKKRKKKKSLAVDNKDADLPDLSFQQWRNLLNAEPTAKNAYDFAKVFKMAKSNKRFYSLAS